MNCVYRSIYRGGPAKPGRIRQTGSIFTLLGEKGVSIERVLKRDANIFVGGLYIAANEEKYLPVEGEIRSQEKKESSKESVYVPATVIRRKLPPPPEGSFIFTPRAYIEPSYLRHFKDYQIEGVRFMFERLRNADGAVLADEMGLGKTFQAVAVARLFCRAGGKVLVASPCSLAGVWEKEINRWAGDIRVYNGVQKPAEKYSGREDILLLSYERLATCKSMHMCKISLVICDEAHRLRTCTSRALNALKKLDSKRLLLTGTPFQNTIGEYKTLLGLVDIRATTAKSPKELSAIAGEAVLRRRIERTSVSLPQKDEVIWLVRNLEYKETEKMYEQESTSMGIQSLQKIRGYLSNSPSKWQLFCKLAEEILREKHSLVIVSRYIEGVKRAGKEIKEMAQRRRVPISPSSVHLFHGEMDVTGRESAITSFSAPGQKVIILSAKCGGEGLTLIKATRMIILDSDWNPANDLQVMARIWRLGQTVPVVIHRLFLMGTVEEHVLLVQLKKKDLQRQIESEGSQGVKREEIEAPVDQEIYDMFHLVKDSVVHRWMGCSCTEESNATVDGYVHEHKENALVLKRRVNEGK